MSIYEMHLGSWRRVAGEGNRSLSYRELAPLLADYLEQLGFTHVEFMPVMDHPFFGSWGYQITGYFAPSGNFGTPQDLMFLDRRPASARHRRHSRLGAVPFSQRRAWPRLSSTARISTSTPIRAKVIIRSGTVLFLTMAATKCRASLISNALFWLDKYHIDGLRVDAVASMLYLDYARKDGEWIPNRYGGRENIEAIEFLRRLNQRGLRKLSRRANHRGRIDRLADGVAAQPRRAAWLRSQVGHGLDARHVGILCAKTPVHRRYHQNNLTFRMIYAFHENFVLPLSHDEVGLRQRLAAWKNVRR